MTLVEHARRELELVGEEPGMSACLVATVGAYASYGHSGGSHQEALRTLMLLLDYRALTPLTADPAEWIDRSQASGTPWWQNERDSRAMSCDGGRTYWLVGDDQGQQERRMYTSEAPPNWVRVLREQHRLSDEDAVAAVWKYLDRGPLTDSDRQALDGLVPAARTSYMIRRWGVHGGLIAALLYEPAREPGVMG